MKGKNTAYADHAFKLSRSLTFMQNDYYVKVALMNAFYYIQEEQSVWLVSVNWYFIQWFWQLEITAEQLKSIRFIAMEIGLAAYWLLTLLTRTIWLSWVYLAAC